MAASDGNDADGGPAVVAVVGPTAAGKTSLGVELARRLDGDVVNADSMQLYRGMDVGTAKATPAERRGVAHHLLDVWDVREDASVAEYQRAARAVVADLRHRGRVPLLVGGSGLYVAAVLDDLRFPGTDPALRASLEAELARVGPAALHARLAAVDTEAAARIDPANGRRVVRALEVVQLTGRPFRASLPGPVPVVPAVRIGLDVPLPELDRRIEQRVARMWEEGLVEEVRALDAAGLRAGRTASRALGYASVLRMLDGQLDETAARAETAQATRRFARRQLSWFRRDPLVRWLPAGEGADVLGAALAEVASGPR